MGNARYPRALRHYDGCKIIDGFLHLLIDNIVIIMDYLADFTLSIGEPPADDFLAIRAAGSQSPLQLPQ